MTQILWKSSSEAQGRTALSAFMKKHGFHDYPSCHRWSIKEFKTFWSEWLKDSGMIVEGNPVPAVTQETHPLAQFFPRVTLNFAENLLRHRSTRIALRGVTESREECEMSYAQLFKDVARIRRGLDQLGIREGDRVAGFVPNAPESVVAMLATTSSGAVWSSCSPDFGVQGVLDRFGQIKPRVLLTANGYRYGGKTHDCLEKIVQIAKAIPEIEKIIVFPFLPSSPTTHPELGSKVVAWDDFGERADSILFPQLPFNHPLYIMYSSGTTGVPKCIVHGAGGTLLQHTKELILHSDLRADDHIMYFTTCGWMMWNWLVSSLFTGATVTLYDGSPTTPSIESLWQLADRTKITHFGTSPKFIGSCRGQIFPKKTLKLEKLRVILSTGSPLLPEDFDWIYEHVKSDVQLSSISGGTDIISCFMLGNPLLPVIRGEIQCFGLGMDCAAFDEHQKPVTRSKGELVCRTPFPSAPVQFWNDPGNKKYLNAYFSRDPHKWFHGDFIEVTESQGSTGGIVVYGRSDATLNPGGVRIGTAEIYRLVETLPEIEDSIVVGEPWEGDVRVVLFVKIRGNKQLDPELIERIKKTIRAGATPRHVPAVITRVEKIPYTISGKKVELAVLDMIQGREPKNKDALADPTALECYRKK